MKYSCVDINNRRNDFELVHMLRSLYKLYVMNYHRVTILFHLALIIHVLILAPYTLHVFTRATYIRRRSKIALNSKIYAHAVSNKHSFAWNDVFLAKMQSFTEIPFLRVFHSIFESFKNTFTIVLIIITRLLLFTVYYLSSVIYVFPPKVVHIYKL